MTTGFILRSGFLAAFTLAGGYAASFSRCDANQDGATSERFFLWMAEMPYPHPSIDSWALYRIPFQRSARTTSTTGDTPRFGRRTADINREFRVATELSEIETEIEAVKASVLSAWDQKLYELMNYDNDAEAVREANDASDCPTIRYPFAAILEAVRRERFQQFWERVLELATDEELARIRSEAETFWKKSLPAPRDLRRRPW